MKLEIFFLAASGISPVVFAGDNVALVTGSAKDPLVSFLILAAAAVLLYVAHRIVKHKEFRFKKKRKHV